MSIRGAYRPRRGAQRRAEEDAAAAHDPRAQAIADAERVYAATKRALKVRKARLHLRDFIELMMPDPEAPDDVERSLFECEPHHKILIEMVEAIEAKKTMRAACSMPPQHGKSLILSRFGLAWIIGRSPHLRILFATYADSLAQTRGDEVREVLQSAAFREVFPKAVMRRGSQSKTEMAMVAGGTINFLGRNTGTTGRPADLFIIDDPYKNEEEGSSEVTRQHVKDWYSAVVFSRCHVLTPLLIVHTRWNEDDLLGWLTDPEHPENRADPSRMKRWKYVNLPTPVDDPVLAKALGIQPGDPLWPKRFPIEHLREAEKNDPRIYAALYRGAPSPADGDFFKAEHFITYLPEELPAEKDLRFYAASDHALKEKQRSDASCFIPAGVDRYDNLWILPDVWWERKATDKQVEAMIDMMERRRFLWWRAGRDHITGSIGPFLRKRMQERRVFCNIVEGPETGDKMQKAQPFQARMSMGKVRFPAGAPWLMRAKAEMLKFPHGKHDDFVDACSHLGRGLRVMLPAAAPAAANDDEVPKTGTLAWVKWASSQDRSAAQRRKMMGSY